MSISTQGGSTVPPTRISRGLPALRAMLRRVSNLTMASGQKDKVRAAVPPAIMLPCCGLIVRPGNGVGSIT